MLSPAGLIPGLVLAAFALCVVAAVRGRDVAMLLIGGAVALLAIASLFGPALLAGPRQYLLATACIGGAFATSRLRTRFVDPADILILVAAAVLLLALGGQAVTFWPYYAQGAQSENRLGTAAAVLLLAACFGFWAARVDRGVSRVLVSRTPAGFAARVLLPIPFVFPILFSALTTWAAARKLYDPFVGIWMFAMANIVVYAVLIGWAALQLYRSHVATLAAQRDLLAANETLEQRVAQRTTELQREIAERKAAMEQLARSNAELEQFAYIASHDLKEPIRTMNSYAQLLGRRYGNALDRDGREFLAFIEQGARRMHSLVSDLLDYSRTVHEDIPVSDVDLNECASDALADLRAQIEECGATVTVDVLPAITGNRHQLTQLLLNLIGNAVKYRAPGVPPDVHVSAIRKEGEWVLAVRDNGVGIDPQYFNRIFGLFKRLHRDQYPGTGVGLALCKRIVESHQGRIWVESEPGSGSTFYFTVPAAASETRAAHAMY